jgi:hypothetical protein
MPVPVKNFLTAEQVKKLQDVLRENPLPRVREKILIILLQNDGKTHREISKFYSVLDSTENCYIAIIFEL